MKKFNLEVNELLQRNELKSILGGYVDDGSGGMASCSATCRKGEPVKCTGNPCTAVNYSYCQATQSDGTTQTNKCKN